MPKILLNYKKLHDGSFKLYYNPTHVFADMPVCIADMDEEYIQPIVVNINNEAVVVEKEEYEKTHKLFKLKVDKNNFLVEDEDGFEIYLPIDTDITQLMYINGQIVKKEESNINGNV